MFCAAVALGGKAGTSFLSLRRGRGGPPPLAPKLHLLSMGRSGSCFWGEVLGMAAGRPYIFEPFNAGKQLWTRPLPPWSVRDGWAADARSAAHKNLKDKLRCLYTCEGCESLVSNPGDLSRACARPPATDLVVVKTVAMNNASSLMTMLPRSALRGSKFLLLLRDPRVTGRSNACQRMLSLALSVKQLAAAVGRENVRTIFMEQWATNVTQSVLDVAQWAGVAASADVLRMAHDHQRASPLEETSRKLQSSRAARQPWCKEFLDLVGYPECLGPSAAGGLPCVDPSALRDPARTPLTPAEERTLARLWQDERSFSFSELGEALVAQ